MVLNVEQFWAACAALPISTDFEVEVLVNQRAMAEAVIRSGFTTNLRYLSALERVVASLYPNLCNGSENISHALIKGYFNNEHAETYWHACEIARSTKGVSSSEASLVAYALAGYSDRQSDEDNWNDFVYELAEYGIDLQIFWTV